AGSCHHLKFFSADDRTAHIDCGITGMRFAADELVALLDRHDALDLRPGGERLEALMRALVADRANDRALDSAHDMRLVSQLLDFFEHGGLLLLRDIWFENDDHKTKRRRQWTCG